MPQACSPIYLKQNSFKPTQSGFERKTFLSYNIAVTLVVLTTAGEESITAFFEILHCVQNDTAREFVILNGTLCSEVSHSANKWILHFVQNDTAREFVILNGT